MLYQYIIPIENYNCDGIFFKEIFIESEKYPTKEEFIAIIEGIAAEEIVKEAEYPILYGSCIATNTRVIHPKYGDLPFSVKRILPLRN